MKRDHIVSNSSRTTAIAGVRAGRAATEAVAPRSRLGIHKRSGSSNSNSISTLRAEENERKRISRELHDEMGQGLMTLRLYLGSLVQESEGVLKQKAEEALAMVDQTIDGLRRIIARLSPRPLEQFGLVGAIRKEAERLSKQTGMKPHLSLPKDLHPLDHEIEVAAYRSVQEGLHNIGRHSAARNFGVALEASSQALTLRIDDDGTGFSGRARKSSQTFGVVGMRERLQELNGILRIHSRKTGGTRIEIEIPLPDDGELHRQPDAGNLVEAFGNAS